MKTAVTMNTEELRCIRGAGQRKGCARSTGLSLGVLLLCVLAVCPVLASCGQNKDMNSLLSLESRSAKGATPQSPEDLKKGIAQFSADVDKIVELKERTGIYYKLLGSRYEAKKMYGEAYEAYLSAIDFYPANETLYYHAGLCAGYIAKSKEAKGPDGLAEKQKWFATCESSYRRALDLSPRYASALYGLAVLYEFELNRPADALPLAQRVLEVETKNVDAMLLLGRIYYSLGRNQEAVDTYGKVIDTTKVKAKKDAAEANRQRIMDEMNGNGSGK